MSIPQVTSDRIREAIKEFDDRLRSTDDWRQWEANGAYRYALVVDGKRYPPKKIISLATGAPVRQFSGGTEANGYLTRLGFDVAQLTGNFFQESFERF